MSEASSQGPPDFCYPQTPMEARLECRASSGNATTEQSTKATTEIDTRMNFRRNKERPLLQLF